VAVEAPDSRGALLEPLENIRFQLREDGHVEIEDVVLDVMDP
jgi:hypothetical protein